jgi:hypothetical protein
MLRRVLSRVSQSTAPVKAFGQEFVDALPEMARNFVDYWENQRLIAYFIIYSAAVSMLLAGLGAYTDDYWLMVGVAVVYAVSALPFFFWAGQKYHDDNIDVNDLK